MDPQYAPTPPQNQFDFLNAQPAKQKKSFLSSNNPKQKMLISVLFVLAVLIIAIIAVVVFRSLTKKDYSVYKSLVTQQNEIVRIAAVGVTKARDTSVKNYAATIGAVTLTEKNDTLAFARKAGVKINDKDLEAAKDAANDKALATAETNNQYDQKLVELLNSLVIAYQKDIQSAATGVTTKSEKAVVVKLQNNAKIIANAPAK